MYEHLIEPPHKNVPAKTISSWRPSLDGPLSNSKDFQRSPGGVFRPLDDQDGRHYWYDDQHFWAHDEQKGPVKLSTRPSGAFEDRTYLRVIRTDFELYKLLLEGFWVFNAQLNLAVCAYFTGTLWERPTYEVRGQAPQGAIEDSIHVGGKVLWCRWVKPKPMW